MRWAELRFVFLVTLGLVWIPWVGFLAVWTFVLRHCDPKFGCVGGFYFAVEIVLLWAVICASIAAVLHGVDMLVLQPLGVRYRRTLVLLGVAVAVVNASWMPTWLSDIRRALRWLHLSNHAQPFVAAAVMAAFSFGLPLAAGRLVPLRRTGGASPRLSRGAAQEGPPDEARKERTRCTWRS